MISTPPLWPATKPCVGLTADQGGSLLKRYIEMRLLIDGFQVVDFGETDTLPNEHRAEFILPLARAVGNGEIERGIALCSSGAGASMAANKVAGVRACLIYETFTARQAVEEDNLNLLCLGGLVLGPAAAWELAHVFLNVRHNPATCHQRRITKSAPLELAPAYCHP